MCTYVYVCERKRCITSETSSSKHLSYSAAAVRACLKLTVSDCVCECVPVTKREREREIASDVDICASQGVTNVLSKQCLLCDDPQMSAWPDPRQHTDGGISDSERDITVNVREMGSWKKD